MSACICAEPFGRNPSCRAHSAPDQLALFPPPATLSPEEAAVVRQALSYALARRSAGCPYAPEWGDGQVVHVVAPLLGRLPRG